MKKLSLDTLILAFFLSTLTSAIFGVDFEIKRGEKLVHLKGLYPVEIIRF